ncbi:hypothetical protein, partial [Candidatus Hakubella thermalkaliphila]
LLINILELSISVRMFFPLLKFHHKGPENGKLGVLKQGTFEFCSFQRGRGAKLGKEGVKGQSFLKLGRTAWKF